ncbi:hypothetical protein HXX76_015560 [Chlamydomonas incerta]|uniref:Uncharacterized protein n=1 Tax=Chlamydomonas incerta TaxID=51695 RepID=A0A835VRP2_CHLIN|nr:hypothetical protein HXX76_015560 [Chlamydomonas incerta]|eukprot:KAG2423044.1 hypothetical protein HXX76_015560 [Chlamydomonas incerta]
MSRRTLWVEGGGGSGTGGGALASSPPRGPASTLTTLLEVAPPAPPALAAAGTPSRPPPPRPAPSAGAATSAGPAPAAHSSPPAVAAGQPQPQQQPQQQPGDGEQPAGPGPGQGAGRGGALRRLREQSYDTWRPVPSLGRAVAVMAALVGLGLGLGLPLLVASLHGAAEVRLRYDDAPLLLPVNCSSSSNSSSSSSCNGSSSRGGGDEAAAAAGGRQQAAIWAAGADGAVQRVWVTLPRGLTPPVYVMYSIQGLYGTHKRYLRSVSREQLAGQQPGAAALDKCEPQRYLGGAASASLPAAGLVNPCGLRPASLFNDSFALAADPATCGGGGDQGDQGGSGTDPGEQGQQQGQQPQGQPAQGLREVALHTEDVVWGLERRSLYGHPYNTTNSNPLPPPFGNYSPGAGGGRPGWRRLGGPLLHGGVGQDPALEVWLRPSARPDTLKPYAVVRKALPAGCRLRLTVAARYTGPYAWGGAKTVLLATQSWYGLRAPGLVVAGSLLGLAAAAAAAGAAALLVLAAVRGVRGRRGGW